MLARITTALILVSGVMGTAGPEPGDARDRRARGAVDDRRSAR
jgi:hypothetical protein